LFKQSVRTIFKKSQPTAQPWIPIILSAGTLCAKPPEGEVKKDGKPAGKQPVLDLMGRVSVLCNDAELFEEDGAWKVEGDPLKGGSLSDGRRF